MTEAEQMERYNGWRNYETWLVCLWLTNEESSSKYWELLAAELWRDAKSSDILTREQVARHTLAERLKDEILEHNPCPEACLYADLLHAAISEVDWYEIADSFLDDVPKNEGDE